MPTGNDSTRYGIRQLAQLSGVPRRTIRYYVQKGLIPPPLGAGRGHYYLPEHLKRLLEIRELRQSGRSLEEIRYLLDAGEKPSAKHQVVQVASIELASRIRIANGVEIVVTHGAEPPTSNQLRALATAASQILSRESALKQRHDPPN